AVCRSVDVERSPGRRFHCRYTTDFLPSFTQFIPIRNNRSWQHLYPPSNRKYLVLEWFLATAKIFSPKKSLKSTPQALTFQNFLIQILLIIVDILLIFDTFISLKKKETSSYDIKKKRLEKLCNVTC
uniref:Uncharacterized protein n=1 Tax=Glossina palpalis gambiensis TaxID=67801 RepID=A0A1B0AR48_9MUSC